MDNFDIDYRIDSTQIVSVWEKQCRIKKSGREKGTYVGEVTYLSEGVAGLVYKQPQCGAQRRGLALLLGQLRKRRGCTHLGNILGARLVLVCPPKSFFSRISGLTPNFFFIWVQ